MQESSSKTPNNKTKEKKRSQSSKRNQDEKNTLDVPRRDRYRSTSLPTRSTSEAKIQSEGKRSKEWPPTRSRNRSFKSVLECIVAGQWISALGRVEHLKKNHPEFTQTNVNITSYYITS